MNILSQAARQQIYSKSSIDLIEDRIRFARESIEKANLDQMMTVDLYGPEFGWIDLKLSSVGQETLHIELSYVYNPLPGLRTFLEQMATMNKEPVEYPFDSERYFSYFRCEPLPQSEHCLFIACTDLDTDPVFRIIGKPKNITLKLYAELIHFMSTDHVNGPNFGCWWEPYECCNTEEYESREEEFDQNEAEGSPRWADHDIIQRMIRSEMLDKMLLEGVSINEK